MPALLRTRCLTFVMMMAVASVKQELLGLTVGSAVRTTSRQQMDALVCIKYNAVINTYYIIVS